MNTTYMIEGINSPRFRLIWIEAFVLFAIAALFLLLVFGSCRRRSSSEAVKLIVWAAYVVSYTLVSYTTGLMQSSPYGNSLFVVWAICLMLVLGSVDSLSAYSLQDNDSWKRFYVQYLVRCFWVGWLIAAFGKNSNFKAPLWAIYAIALLSTSTRMGSFRAASKYYNLSHYTKFVADYMGYEHELEDAVVPNPITMHGYRYVVAGEDTQKCKLEPPDYLLRYRAEDVMTLVTVEHIWQCNGKLLRSESQQGSLLKDICLSMALSKMLNRRFAGFHLAESKLEKTRDFVFQGLLSGDLRYERAFRVIEVELGFVHDFFYTKYAVLYAIHPFCGILLPALPFPFCLWLAYLLFGHFHTPNDTLTVGRNNHRNYDALVTMVIVVAIAMLELWQLYLYIASDWFKVYLISKYVKKPTWQSNEMIEEVIGFVAGRMKAFRYWENRIGQYSLLHTFNYSPMNVGRRVTCGLVAKTKKGHKKGKPVELSNEVKQAVINSLVKSSGRLTNGITSLRANQVEQLLWTCTSTDLRTVTHTILIWHIATTLCYHTLNGGGGGDGQQLPDEDERAEMRTHASVASSLSNYCAYLVAFAPNLLPDHFFDSAIILDALIDEASELLGGATSMQQKYDTLMSWGAAAAAQEDKRLTLMGARLGRQLIDEITDPRVRWKVLSEFWAEMMLYIVPSNDCTAHLETLTRGGEFITHLWALLTHAGILERDDSAGTP